MNTNYRELMKVCVSFGCTVCWNELPHPLCCYIPITRKCSDLPFSKRDCYKLKACYTLIGIWPVQQRPARLGSVIGCPCSTEADHFEYHGKDMLRKLLLISGSRHWSVYSDSPIVMTYLTAYLRSMANLVLTTEKLEATRLLPWHALCARCCSPAPKAMAKDVGSVT